MSQRYFRTNDANLYESIRGQLDAAWGHPTPDGKTVTCIDPIASAPQNLAGQIFLSVRDEGCNWEPVVMLLPQLLASGEVQEIDAAAYNGVVNPGP